MKFGKDFYEALQAGVVIFCMQDDNDVLYCGIAIQPFHAYSCIYFFLLSLYIFRQRCFIDSSY